MAPRKDMHNVIPWILSSISRRRALKYLFTGAAEATGRNLARHIGFSHQQAHNALRLLEQYGLVEHRIFGPSHLFRLTKLARRMKEQLAG